MRWGALWIATKEKRFRDLESFPQWRFEHHPSFRNVSDKQRNLWPFLPNYAPDIFLLFCFTYGLAETLLIYLFAKAVFSKFHLPTNEEIHPLWLPYLCGGISLVLGVACYFFFLPGSYLCLGFVIFWSVVAFVEEVPYQRSWLWAIQVVLLFVSILLFALLYTKLLEDRGLLLSSIPFILSFLPNALNASLPPLCVKNKINKP